jgi:signal transduction histidine kinase
MTESASSDDLRRRVRLAIEEPWTRTRPLLHLAADALLAIVAGLLWSAGHPAWRVAAIGAAVAVAATVHALGAVQARTTAAPAPSARDAGGWASLGLGFAAVAVSGGVRSPLLVPALATAPLILFQHGWTRPAQFRLGGMAAATLAIAALPRAWTGPTVASGAFWAIFWLALLLVVATTILYLVLLTRVAHAAVREASRAREALALHAIARARELEQLGAQLSHELKNPLSAIKTLVQVTVRAEQDPASRERLEVVESEVRRMQQVLQDYLSFSRPLEKLHRGPLGLGALADEVVALVSGRASEAGVTLRRRGDAHADADRRRIQDALLNLLVNALDATPPGGRVDVEIVETDGEVRVFVRDSGRGMPADVLARIGTPFFTTREEGTGLGVALARATFVQHGGTLEYASAPGEGTTATATLPARAERRADGARARGG